ncbi:MAG: glycosyltransferase family 4 protein [Candidatus Omnitrophica bacterium]|nr:glycosyltransferase family 4 protein [Candidatus Omnitrophota bacterium]
MKVLQVTTHINIGGITNYILILSQTLKAKGVDAVIVSSGGGMKDEFCASGIRHIPLDIKTKFEFGPKVIGAAFCLANIIRREKVDIVHAHTRVSQVASALASRMTGVPYITTCHGYFKLRSRKIFDTWGSKVIAISEAVEKHLRNDLGVEADRVELIYSGVDARRFGRTFPEAEKIALRKALGLKDGPVIGSIGRLSPVKGHRYLIEAMAGILASRSNAQCIIVGDGPEENSLKSLAEGLGLGEDVHFIPSCSDTAKLLSIMDVFVFPSVKEGLGIALLEAMAAGCACVASEAGGIIDIIGDPSAGTLTPVGNAGAISKAVITLIDNERLRKDMGTAARKLVSEKFSLDVMGDKVIQSYKKVLGC